jgi:TonB-linked SusC/RagA family outer membrane protein
MRKMSHMYLLCAGVALSQLAIPPAFAGDIHPSLKEAINSTRTWGEGIHGQIKGPDGNPVAGVNVVLKRTGKGTITDANGNFSINASKGDVLVVSGVGFTTEQITVGDGPVALTLKEGHTQLEDVVVTALGIKKQARAIGYSTTQLDGSKFTQSREINIGNALSGQVAGVSVSGVSTGPSGSSRVVIRGNGSLSSNNQPLYVVDGIPYDNTSQGSGGQWGGMDLGDGLSNISPDDIESMQVLKGVAASALYGYRGGNGAILITTKSGSKNKGLSIDLNDNITANSVYNVTDYQYQYGAGTQGLKPTNETQAQAAPYFSWGAKIDGSPTVNFLGNTVPYTAEKDNIKDFFKTGVTNQVSLGLMGNNEHGSFRLGLNDLALNTFIPNSSMKQQGLNFKTNYNITKRLSMDMTANYIFEHVNNRASFSDAPGNVVASTMYVPNTFDIRWEKPGYNAAGVELNPGTDPYFDNAYWVAYKFQNQTDRNRLTGGLNLKYKLTDWLFAQGGVTRDGYIFDVTEITPSYTSWAPGGQFTQYEENFHELNEYFNLGVNKDFGHDFKLNALVGANSMDNVASIYGVGNVPAGIGSQAPGSQAGPIGPFIIPGFYSANNVSNRPYQYLYGRSHVNSVYGSVDLGYKNFLFLTGTLRNDWFSTLNINTDTYLYPSVSGSFVFSDALKLPSWVTFGKLRASLGVSSNGTTPYQNALTYGLQGYTSASGQPVGYVTQATSAIPNPNLKPLHIEDQEVGAAMDFFKSRVGFDVAVYKKTTTDDILPVTISPTAGYPAQMQNIGKLRNQGVELLLQGTPIQTRHFSWNISWNFANNNSKVLYLGGAQSVIIAGAYARWGSEVNISNVVGLPYGQIMGYDYTYDKNGNRIFGSNGLPIQSAVKPLGSGQYKQTGGLTNDFHYNGFTLSFLIDYKFGAKIYSGTNNLLDYYGLSKESLQGRGTSTGFVGKGVDQSGDANSVGVDPYTYWYDLSVSGANHIASQYVYDASFIKLRSASIAYSLPASMLKRTPIKGVTFSLVGRNLLILMKHTPNIDPESNYNNANSQGLELSGYPPIRSLGANLKVNF